MGIKSEQDFNKKSIEGCTAILEKEYTKAVRIFSALIVDYPDEAASYIRYCRAFYENGKINGEHMRLLDKAEIIIKK